VRRIMTRLSLLSLAGLSIAALAVAAPAGAAAPSAGVRLVSLSPAAKAPNSNIEGNGSKAKFDPDSLKVKQYSEANCTGSSPSISLTLKNKGTKTAYLYNGTSTTYPLAAGKGVDVCVYGTSGPLKKGTHGELLGLSNASGSKVYKGKLDVTITNS